MLIVKRYRLEEVETQDGIFYEVLSEEKSTCTICDKLLKMKERRERRYIDTSGTKQILLIRRLECEDCGKIHHELPDIITPYKRHCTATIESIIADELEAVPCVDTTIHRVKAWYSTIFPYFLNILATLAAKFAISVIVKPKYKETIRAVANSQNWTFPGNLATQFSSLVLT